jgi:hypothetical protein
MCKSKYFWGRRGTMIIGALVTMTFLFAYTEVKSNAQNLGFTCAISFSLVSTHRSIPYQVDLASLTLGATTEHLLRYPRRLHPRSAALGPPRHGQRHLDWAEQDHGDRECGCGHGGEYGDSGTDLYLRRAVYCHGGHSGGVPL